MMHEHGKSDEGVVPAKSSNKDAFRSAEATEGRPSAKGNANQQNTSRTLSRPHDVHNALERVRKAAKRNKKLRFTSLFHHITRDRLRAAYHSLRRGAASGVDGVTWKDYGVELEHRLKALHRRLHTGGYKAKPTRRVFIPKPDGGLRPLGIAALEDKIVQRVVVEILNAIYEVDFVGFSYGFRAGRNQHQALDALAVGILRKKVNWVLDADVKRFFDTMDHDWLMRFLEHRIADPRLLRLLHKWLRAGVLEDGKRSRSDAGSPQGAPISPLLGNIYLHYVIDLWASSWRRSQTSGDMVIVRYADDIEFGFQRQVDAQSFMRALDLRLRRFKLSMNPEKTRLIRFGTLARQQCHERGLGKPSTFTFLGFTHICGKTWQGRFMLCRKTASERMRRTLHAIRKQLRRRLHQSIEVQGAWLRRVLQGYFAYYAVPTNGRSMERFRTEVTRLWLRTLRRRSQRHRITWAKMATIAARWLPPARVLHPWPDARFDASTRGRSPVQ
ncbi:MAG: group II intron reverse transcriptase/maturase [Myxococcota bacterium]